MIDKYVDILNRIWYSVSTLDKVRITTMTNDTINIAHVTPKAFADFVGEKIFTATFVKKDGTVRVMNCRREVKKHLKGGERAWDFEKKGYISVYDLQAEDYRVINTATLIKVTANGQTLVNLAMQKDANLAKISELANVIATNDTDTADIVNYLRNLANGLEMQGVLGVAPKAKDGLKNDVTLSPVDRMIAEG